MTCVQVTGDMLVGGAASERACAGVSRLLFASWQLLLLLLLIIRKHTIVVIVIIIGALMCKQ